MKMGTSRPRQAPQRPAYLECLLQAMSRTRSGARPSQLQEQVKPMLSNTNSVCRQDRPDGLALECSCNFQVLKFESRKEMWPGHHSSGKR